MHTPRNKARRAAARLLTAGFTVLLLAAQLGAVAHAVKHDAHKTDAACALCVFADHLGKTPVSGALAQIAVPSTVPSSSPPTTRACISLASGYHSRAPPLPHSLPR